MDCGLCFATEERFSAIDGPPLVVLAPRAWLSLAVPLALRPDASACLELVVLDGIVGMPGRGDCGSLVLPVLFNPLLCAGASDGGFEGEPVSAARESARADSTSTSFSREKLGACPLPTLDILVPRGGIILPGRESLLAGGGMILLSSSMAVRLFAGGSTSALCLGVSLEVSEPLRLDNASFVASSSFVSSAMAPPVVASLDGFLEN